MGRGTYTDIPRHVNAATRLLKLRIMDRSVNIDQPFDRLAVESVLYQMFLATMGSWHHPSELDYRFDEGFWLRAERVLAQSMLFEGPAISMNSPVLGVPLALFKHVLSIKQHWQSSLRHDRETLDDLKSELESWEREFLSDDLFPASPSSTEELPKGDTLYRDTTRLYVLISSLMIQQLYSEGDLSPIDQPQPAATNSWQMQKATEILRQHHDDVEWARCYIGNWPVYTLGFFMSAPEDISLVRDDLRRRWELMKFSQLDRYRRDLEATWAGRGNVT